MSRVLYERQSFSYNRTVYILPACHPEAEGSPAGNPVVEIPRLRDDRKRGPYSSVGFAQQGKTGDFNLYSIEGRPGRATDTSVVAGIEYAQ